MINCRSVSIPASAYLLEFNSYSFIKYLPPHSAVVSRGFRTVLPEKKPGAPSHTLVLDLDETLVHCSTEPLDNYSLRFPVTFTGIDYMVYVKYRPYFLHFLRNVSKCYEVVIFTASQKAYLLAYRHHRLPHPRRYAEKLLNAVDPEGILISHRLYRDSCIYVDGNYIKDLTVLGRDFKKCILVDNSPHAFGYQIDNGVPIESWFDDASDSELITLLPFLLSLTRAPDVIPQLREKFKNYQKVLDAH